MDRDEGKTCLIRTVSASICICIKNGRPAKMQRYIAFVFLLPGLYHVGRLHNINRPGPSWANWGCDRRFLCERLARSD